MGTGTFPTTASVLLVAAAANALAFGAIAALIRPAPPPPAAPATVRISTDLVAPPPPHEPREAPTDPVFLALDWLARHQREDGSWESATGGPANTGLALLAFLGAGETDRHGEYKTTVKEAAEYLKAIQDAEGCFGARDQFSDHAICARAMSELYALTASPCFKPSAQMAIDYLGGARDASGGWGEGVTVWAVLALHSAKRADLRVDPALFDDAARFLDRAGLRRGETIARVFVGEDPVKSEAVKTSAEAATHRLRAGDLDTLTWYFGALGAFQVGGEPWQKWNAAKRGEVVPRQLREGDERGSWDPHGAAAATLGRVGTTAIYAMVNELYYRYGGRVFGVR